MAEDVKNILRYAGLLRDGIEPVSYKPVNIATAYYLQAQVSGCWYPAFSPGDCFAEGVDLGQIRDIFGNVLQTIYAEMSGVLLYQTVFLAIRAAEPLAAYAQL